MSTLSQTGSPWCVSGPWLGRWQRAGKLRPLPASQQLCSCLEPLLAHLASWATSAHLSNLVYTKPTESGWRRGGSHPNCCLPRILAVGQQGTLWWSILLSIMRSEKVTLPGPTSLQGSIPNSDRDTIQVTSDWGNRSHTLFHRTWLFPVIWPQESYFQEIHIEPTVPKTQSGNPACLPSPHLLLSVHRK